MRVDETCEWVVRTDRRLPADVMLPDVTLPLTIRPNPAQSGEFAFGSASSASGSVNSDASPAGENRLGIRACDDQASSSLQK